MFNRMIKFRKLDNTKYWKRGGPVTASVHCGECKLVKPLQKNRHHTRTHHPVILLLIPRETLACVHQDSYS